MLDLAKIVRSTLNQSYGMIKSGWIWRVGVPRFSHTGK